MMPLITGANANEGVTMPAASSAQKMRERRTKFGSLAPAFLDAYACGSDAQARESSRAMVGDRNFVWQNRAWVRHARAQPAATFHYRFTRKPPIPGNADYLESPARGFGAFHGAEIPYVFRNLHVRQWPWQPADHSLRRPDVDLLAELCAQRESERNRPPRMASVQRIRPEEPLLRRAVASGVTSGVGSPATVG